MSDLSDRGLPSGQKGKYAIGKPQRFWIWVFFVRFNFWEFKCWERPTGKYFIAITIFFQT